ncbi:Hypothetical protein, putative, partial [Bodo saltans]
MFHGPGQRLSKNTSNEDLWEQEIIAAEHHHQHHHRPEVVSFGPHASTQQLDEHHHHNNDGLLRIRGNDALPSMYRHVPPRTSRRGSSAGDGSASPTGSPKQLSTAASWRHVHEAGEQQQQQRPELIIPQGGGASRSFRSSGRNSTPLSDDGGARPFSRHSSAAQSISSAASDGGGGGDTNMHVPVTPPTYRAHFLQDHFECPLLPIEGRDNPIVLMRQGYFHIRLESDADWLSIAKLEIDGNMTRCNFRLQPHTKHTVKETRLDVGQHAVPLTFDPSEHQLEPITSAEDVERHVGCVRILFFEAYERPGTLKWEWDVNHPAEVICLDYGSLDSFAHVYPSLREYLPGGGHVAPPAAARRKSTTQVAKETTAAVRGHIAVPNKQHLLQPQHVQPASSFPQRVSDAFERHVERSMKTKSHNAANMASGSGSANTSMGHTTRPAGFKKAEQHHHRDPAGLGTATGRSRSQSPQPSVASLSNQNSQVHRNPLACLDRATGRLASASLQTALSDVVAPSENTNTSSAANRPTTHHRHLDTNPSGHGNICSKCATIMEEERSAFRAREENLKHEIIFLTKRLAILEGKHRSSGSTSRDRAVSSNAPPSRSSSTGSAGGRQPEATSKKIATTTNTAPLSMSTTQRGGVVTSSAASSPKETKAS